MRIIFLFRLFSNHFPTFFPSLFSIHQPPLPHFSPYVKKPIVNGFRTLKGDIVRSKSELIIADRLWLNGIPYKYECPIMINGQIIHPDFTILRRSDNKILYLEHCGMVDKPEYAESMVNRINDYNKEGITLGDRLFLSMETSATPLDVTAIDNLINTCFK